MKQYNLTIVHPPNVKIKVEEIMSVYAPNDYVYFMPSQYDSFAKYATDLYRVEKDKNEWIRKYDKLLKGLQYWREKALQK